MRMYVDQSERNIPAQDVLMHGWNATQVGL